VGRSYAIIYRSLALRREGRQNDTACVIVTVTVNHDKSAQEMEELPTSLPQSTTI